MVGFTQEAVEAHARINAVVAIVSALPLEGIERLAEEYRLAETTLPLFDPTAFQRDGKKLRATAKVTDGLLAFRRLIDEVRDDLS
jgi:hypothetical protein